MQIQRTSVITKNSETKVRVFIAEHDEPLEDGESFLSFCLPSPVAVAKPLREFRLAALYDAQKLVRQEIERLEALDDKTPRK